MLCLHELLAALPPPSPPPGAPPVPAGVDRDAREPALRRGRRRALIEELHEHLVADLLRLVVIGKEEAAERQQPSVLGAVERVVAELAARGRLHMPCPSAPTRPDEATPAVVDSSGPSLRRGGRRGKCMGMEPALARALAALTPRIYDRTVRDGERRHGMSSPWVTQVSGHPPLLMASVDRRHSTHDILARTRRFALNVVGERGRALEDYFYSAASRRPDNLDKVAWEDSPDGLPLLRDAMVGLECRVEQAIPAGDHTLFVATVERVTRRTAAPETTRRSCRAARSPPRRGRAPRAAPARRRARRARSGATPCRACTRSGRPRAPPPRSSGTCRARCRDNSRPARCRSRGTGCWRACRARPCGRTRAACP